jgi:hypothetical protein
MPKTITALLALAIGTAHAGYISGNELLSRIDAERTDYIRHSFAQGYITGVVDAHDGDTFCVPDNVRTGQLFDLTRKMLMEYPERRHDTEGATFVLAAMIRAFPCSTRRQEMH